MGDIVFKSGQKSLSTRTNRTVRTDSKMYETYRSWKLFMDREHTLSIRKKRQWVMLCSSQGRKDFRSVRIIRSVRTVKWFHGSYFSCPISHSVNAIIKCMMASYTICHIENIFFLSKWFFRCGITDVWLCAKTADRTTVAAKKAYTKRSKVMTILCQWQWHCNAGWMIPFDTWRLPKKILDWYRI